MLGILWELSTLASFLFSCWWHSPVSLGLSPSTHMQWFSADNSLQLPFQLHTCLLDVCSQVLQLKTPGGWLRMHAKQSPLLFWLAKVVCISNRKEFWNPKFYFKLESAYMKLASALVNFLFFHHVPAGGLWTTISKDTPSPKFWSHISQAVLEFTV